MDRRSFLQKLGLLVGGVALEQAIPLNRVWSFPTVIKYGEPVIYPELALTVKWITTESLRLLEANLRFREFDQTFWSTLKVGDRVRIARPRRYELGPGSPQASSRTIDLPS